MFCKGNDEVRKTIENLENLDTNVCGTEGFIKMLLTQLDKNYRSYTKEDIFELVHMLKADLEKAENILELIEGNES